MSLKIIVLFAASLIKCSLAGTYETRECPNARYHVKDVIDSYIVCNSENRDACIMSPDEEEQVVYARFQGQYPDDFGGFSTVQFILTGDNFNITLVTQKFEHTYSDEENQRGWEFDFVAEADLPENLPWGEKGTIRAIADYGCEDYGFCIERDLVIKNEGERR